MHKRAHKTRHLTQHRHQKQESGGVATLTAPEDQTFTERRNTQLNRPVSNRIQPYNPAWGFDTSRYDMRRGEIGIPSVPNPKPQKVPPAPANQSTGLCVECGRGVAPGQNYVCREHMKTN